MEQAVSKAIEALDVTLDRDSATLELTRIYAYQLDQVAIIRRAADKALKHAEESGDDALIEEVRALRAKVSEVGTVKEIGARMLTALDALLMTPKARAAALGKGDASDEPADPLDELNARRRASQS